MAQKYAINWKNDAKYIKNDDKNRIDRPLWGSVYCV